MTTVDTAAFGALHVQAAGDGEAVLLLHGIGSSSESFAPQLDALATDFRLLAYDAPGYARSGEPPHQLTLDDYADAAAAVLDASGVGAAHVAGVSWGGVVATRLALRAPERVRTLALIGSTFGRKGNAKVLEGFEQRIASLRRDGGEAWARARASRVLSPAAPDDLRGRVVAIMAAAVRETGFASASASLAATDHRDVLGDVVPPTLVLVGELDAVTGVEDSRALSDRIPGATLHVVPGAGHLVNQEQPETVNDALRRHWTTHRRNGGAP